MNFLQFLLGPTTRTAPIDSLNPVLPAPTQTTAELIAQIHNEFNSAGDILLASAKAVLEGTDAAVIEKGKRLEAAGFGNTHQAKQTQSQAAEAEKARAQQQLIMDYALRYPTNRFITRAQVDIIAAKYNLVVGDTSAYTGFVPDKNLREIEAFDKRFQRIDAPAKVIRIDAWAHQSVDGQDHRRFAKDFPGNIIPEDHPNLSMHGLFGPIYSYPHNRIRAERFTRINTSAKLIAAPAKDMDTSKLTQQNGHWFKAKQVHIPDPVVLQPVRGGYLIVTAWGDEASDPLVVNSQNN